MSTNTLFKKAAVFTDIHYGARQNSYEHNNNCSKFVDWFIKQAHKVEAETCLFLGDLHHFRSHLNVATMNYILRDMEKLNNSFEQVFMITGNHDLFYKDKRDLNSFEFGKLFPKIQIINKIFTKDDVTILPWLVKDEWKKVNKIKSKYVFGHLELPHFKMNAMIEMPDSGTIQAEHFKSQDYVFSGHFHKRQKRGNIIYIGNPFPHNFADAWDDERGMMLLEWDKEPEFINWSDGPKYRTIKLTQLMSDPIKYIVENTHARITIDTEITYEEINFLKEILTSSLKAKEVSFILEKTEDLQSDFVGEIEFETVDQIVIKQLQNIESNTYDKGLLISLYEHLDSE